MLFPDAQLSAAKVRAVLALAQSCVLLGFVSRTEAHEWPDGDVGPRLAISNGTVRVRFQRVSKGRNLGFWEARLDKDLKYTEEYRISPQEYSWAPGSSKASLPGYWVWNEGHWHTIDPRFRHAAMLATLRSNKIDTVELGAEGIMFAPDQDPFILDNEKAGLIGYAKDTEGGGGGFAAIKYGQPAYLCFFSKRTAKLLKKVKLGRFTPSSVWGTLAHGGVVMREGRRCLVWVRDNDDSAKHSLVFTSIDLATLNVSHQELRSDLSGSTPLSSLLLGDQLYLAFHHQKSPEELAEIQVIKVDLK